MVCFKFVFFDVFEQILLKKDSNIMESLRDPNLNSNVYRNMTATDRPPVTDKHLQFILIYNERSAILGGSNMADRYWSGTVWYYNDFSDFDIDKAFVATKLESGVCDGAFLEHNKFVISEDTGGLQVLCLAEVPDTHLQEIQSLGYACLHDSSLVTLSVFHDNEHLVTGDLDSCIKVWNIAELIAMHSYHYAHQNAVTSIDVQPRSNSIFVSTSLDCEALMWDIRQAKPALSILKKDVGLTAVNWNSILDHIIAIGSDNGDISLLDVRKPHAPVLQEACIFPRSIQKLLFNPNPERSEELAGCCDDTLVQVLDIKNNFSSVYKNEDHTDFVRGLSWYKDKLFSCSWDSTVLKHTIHTCNSH
ncbi:methylosome protein 50-like isoform X1 [Hylaeus anthracinus]|uniref:methylosome protein 50-like isoform X1 n=2 Tax=Hylaeus anthracinus TaxID=313031 RepID=UPI0023B93DF2|nr:methylosome protein 50-like isoform X1 [Hylaeus anthracinus]